jgi:hypothetical protein
MACPSMMPRGFGARRSWRPQCPAHRRHAPGGSLRLLASLAPRACPTLPKSRLSMRLSRSPYLSPQHERFAPSYLAHDNAARATPEAGYSAHSAHNIGMNRLGNRISGKYLPRPNRDEEDRGHCRGPRASVLWIGVECTAPIHRRADDVCRSPDALRGLSRVALAPLSLTLDVSVDIKTGGDG